MHGCASILYGEKVHTHSLVENMKMHTEKGDIYTFAHKN